MTTLHTGIASYEEMKARTLAIAAGELRPQVDDPQVWLPSFEHFAAVLSSHHRALLRVIHQERPESLLALAGSTGRTARSLSRTLRTLERYGLVRLHRGPRGQVRPEAPYSDVQVTLSLQQGDTRGAAPGPRDIWGPMMSMEQGRAAQLAAAQRRFRTELQRELRQSIPPGRVVVLARSIRSEAAPLEDSG